MLYTVHMFTFVIIPVVPLIEFILLLFYGSYVRKYVHGHALWHLLFSLQRHRCMRIVVFLGARQDR